MIRLQARKETRGFACLAMKHRFHLGGKDLYPGCVVKADWREVRLETRKGGRPLELSWEGEWDLK